MESCMISTTNNMSKAQCSSDEESTWTFYIDDQDFKGYPPCASEDEYEYDQYESDNDSLLLSGCQSGSSMASASACSPVKKHRYNQVPSQGTNFSGKRRKIKASFVDPELEDSATSPDNSPKVNDFNQFYMNSKEMIDPKTIFQGKGDNANQNTEGLDFHCTALRRKGLCVAPISMLYKCVS